MLDIKFIRENPEAVNVGLRNFREVRRTVRYKVYILEPPVGKPRDSHIDSTLDT